MMMAVVVLLAGLCGYLGMRLHAASSENAALQANILQLKRRLGARAL